MVCSFHSFQRVVVQKRIHVCKYYILACTANLQPSAFVAFDDIVNSYSSFHINWFAILPSAKERMHEHDEELEIYDDAFKTTFR